MHNIQRLLSNFQINIYQVEKNERLAIDLSNAEPEPSGFWNYDFTETTPILLQV